MKKESLRFFILKVLIIAIILIMLGQATQLTEIDAVTTDASSASINLKVLSKTFTTVSLEWEAPSDNELVEGYEIYLDGVKVGDSKGTNYTDLTVPHNSTHTYVVKAYDKSNNICSQRWSGMGNGENYSGQLGNQTYDLKAPTLVNDLKDIVSVAAGGDYSMALRNDGTVWEWGNDKRSY